MTTTTSPANHNSVLATTSPTTTATNNNKKNNKFYETRAKCLKSLDGEWKANPSGTLSLESDANGKRIVIRYDATGKVTFNCRLPTEIAKVEQKNGKGQTKRFIQFLTKLEEGKRCLCLCAFKPKNKNWMHCTKRFENWVTTCHESVNCFFFLRQTGWTGATPKKSIASSKYYG